MRIEAPRQRGVALVVGLVMLTVLTLLVVTAVKIGILELKIGGVSYGAAQNFANIDLALSRWMADNSGNFTPGCLNLDRSDPRSCFYHAAPDDVQISGGPGNYIAKYDLHAGKVEVQAQEVSCLGDYGRGRGNNVRDTATHEVWNVQTVDTTARAQGKIYGLTVVRQGSTRTLAAGDSGC